MGVSRFIYSGGDNNSSVVSYVISGGGHVWFDIDIEGSNTSKIIWNFFFQAIAIKKYLVSFK